MLVDHQGNASGPNIVFQGNWERDDSFILFMILPKYGPWKMPFFSRFMKKKILNDPNVMLLNVKQTLDMCRIIPNILSLRVRDQAGIKFLFLFWPSHISHLIILHQQGMRFSDKNWWVPKLIPANNKSFLLSFLLAFLADRQEPMIALYHDTK